MRTGGPARADDSETIQGGIRHVAPENIGVQGRAVSLQKTKSSGLFRAELELIIEVQTDEFWQDMERRQREGCSPIHPPVSQRNTADVVLLLGPLPRFRPAGETIVAIGASTGGTEAIRTVLQAMPLGCPGNRYRPAHA